MNERVKDVLLGVLAVLLLVLAAPWAVKFFEIYSKWVANF